MRIIKKQAVQVHPIPDRIMDPKGPFPAELYHEQDIIDDYKSALSEDGSDFSLGATAQNNFTPPKHLRCAYCLVRVLETEKEFHVCEA